MAFTGRIGGDISRPRAPPPRAAWYAVAPREVPMTVKVEGAELHYSTRGSGPTCLFPSSMGVKAYERQTPPPLPDHLRLVFVDLRGSGQSTGDPSALTHDVVAQDLEAVRVHLGVEQVIVLGHSILGSLAIEYARRFPDS